MLEIGCGAYDSVTRNRNERCGRNFTRWECVRFRVHQAPLIGVRRTADIVFPSVRLAIFVDGCFWHGCPIHATMPRANGGWWARKIAANQERDRDTDAVLTEAGWTVVLVWEHEAPADGARTIAETVKALRRLQGSDN